MENIVVYIDGTRMVGETEEGYYENSINFCTNGDKEYILFTDIQCAGEEARDYWLDMAKNDSVEFTCMVGEETLISWALGNYAGPGGAYVSSLDEWLDLWLDTPEDHFASYDGIECNFSSRHSEVSEYTVAYRNN